MRKIEETTRFRRDYKREKKGVNGSKLGRQFSTVLAYLVDDVPLPTKFRDHPLTGQWVEFRDCHVRPDLILIYRKPTSDILQLVRLGSHSELSL